ncbi:hypothetical protein LT493_15555 [Streptomyces tricolor]|nr:hypothetical protein [Streptomyces tricolor]
MRELTAAGLLAPPGRHHPRLLLSSAARPSPRPTGAILIPRRTGAGRGGVQHVRTHRVHRRRRLRPRRRPARPPRPRPAGSGNLRAPRARRRPCARCRETPGRRFFFFFVVLRSVHMGV